MTDTTLVNLQHNFCLKPNQAETLKIITNDSSNVFAAIEKGQKYVNLSAMDHEETNDTAKVHMIKQKKTRMLIHTRLSH